MSGRQQFVRGYCFGGILACVLFGPWLIQDGMAAGNSITLLCGIVTSAVGLVLGALWLFTDIHP